MFIRIKELAIAAIFLSTITTAVMAQDSYQKDPYTDPKTQQIIDQYMKDNPPSSRNLTPEQLKFQNENQYPDRVNEYFNEHPEDRPKDWPK